MPHYTYEVILEDDEPGQLFEVLQKMSDPPLTVHPETGQPVRRVISAPFVSTKGLSDGAMAKKIGDDKKLESMGFTKYVNEGGKLKRTAGKGPDMLKSD